MQALRSIALGLVAGLVVASCGGGGGGGSAATTAPSVAAQATATTAPKATCAATSMKMAVPVTPPNVVHLPPYVAQELGFFKDENLTVEIVRFEGGVGALRAMAAGGVDIAGTSSEPLVTAIAQGVEVRAIGTYSPVISQVFAVGAGIKTAADMKGKKIGIQEPGGFADALSRAYLKKNSIDPKDVTFVTTTTAARVQQLISGGVDSGILHVDQVLTVQKNAPQITVLANMWEVLPDYQYAVYAAPAALVNSDKYECIMRALTRANRAMYDPAQRDKIITMAVRETKAEKATVEAAFATLEKAKAWPQNDGLPRKNIEGTVASLLENKQIDKAPKYEDVADLRAVNKVVAQLGKKDWPY